MRLVRFEDPIFNTIQGEGILVGTPSVFVRLWGCDYSCSWCDTKDSWREGSKWDDVPVTEVIDRVRAFHPRHVVITGGNPLLQIGDVCDLLAALAQPWFDDGVLEGRAPCWRPGAHTTVETQASIYDESVARHADLMSLSPKLHAWNDDVVEQYIRQHADCGGLRDLQIKVVVTSPEDVVEALDRFKGLYDEWHGCSHINFILQPESSLGRKGVAMVHSGLDRWMSWAHIRDEWPSLPVVRLIPQVHKGSLYVR